MGNAIMIKGLEGKPKATGTFSVVNGFDKPTITHNLGTQNIFYTFQLADGVQVTDPYRCVSGLGFNPSKIFENRTYKNQSGNDVPMFPLGGEVFGRNYLGAIITTNTSLYSYIANNSNNDIQDITDNSFVIGHRYSFEPNAIYNWSVYSLDSSGQSGEQVFYSASGFPYTKETKINNTGATWVNAFPQYFFYNATNLTDLEIKAYRDFSTATCQGCTNLVNANIECTRITEYAMTNCTSLKNVSFGAVGRPVTLIGNYVFLYDTQSDLTITIYVNATTLAEIPTAVTQYSPWGATNGTIIYRNSTTGEIINS